MAPYQILLVFFLLVASLCAQAQDSAAVRLPSAYLSRVALRVEGLEKKLDQKIEKALRDFEKREKRIYEKLARLDSTKAKQYLASSHQQYEQLQQKLKGTSELSQYIPYLDTLKTSLKFLGEHPELLSKAKDLSGQLTSTIGKVKELEQVIVLSRDHQPFKVEPVLRFEYSENTLSYV